MLGRVRIWCTNDDFPNGKMYYPEEGKFLLNMKGDILEITKDNGLIPASVRNSNVTKMYSTNLIDKFANEIYIGDILGIKHSKYKVVWWEGKIATCWSFNYSNCLLIKEFAEITSIIGNVYENKSWWEL